MQEKTSVNSSQKHGPSTETTQPLDQSLQKSAQSSKADTNRSQEIIEIDYDSVIDYGVITSAYGPYWAKEEIIRMVGKPPEMEDPDMEK